MTERTRSRGRKRDPRIDKRVLEVAGRQLAKSGYDALSIAAVAHDADTTRQAVYRRWPTKASLAAAALQRAVEEPATPTNSLHPYRDLVAELANFQRGVSRPGRMSLVGTMLQDGIDPTVRARYQERVIAPRRRRLRAILELAREEDRSTRKRGPRDRSHSRRGLLVRARACRLETTARLARTHGGTRLASRRRQPVSELTLLDSARELVLSGPEA